MTRYYLDESNPEDGYYEIEERDGRFRWAWMEVDDVWTCARIGEWKDSTADALRDAADDWQLAEIRILPFAIRLRSLAARAERESIHAMGEAS